MKNLLILLALFSGAELLAQDAILSGRVTDDSTKEGLIGVNVVFAPGKGVVTDQAGHYSVALQPGDHTITFSYIGYATVKASMTLGAGEQKVFDMGLAVAAAQLDMVVISAGKFEQRVGEVTQSLTVLRPDLVRNKNITSLSDALDQVPGVAIVDEEPQIRAGSGFSYGAGSRVQVLVDDIPILSGDIGRPNWTFLPLENLEQVEVIKGASSVLYGSSALSGVINVRTAYPRAEPSTRATLFAGTYDAPRVPSQRWWGDNSPNFGGFNFSHSRQIGKFDLVIGGNAFSDQGYIGPEPIPADTIATDPLRTGAGGYDNRVRVNIGTRWRNGKVKGLSYGINANAMKNRNTSVFIWNNITDGIYRPQPGTVTRTRGAQYYIDPYMDYLSKAGMRHTVRLRMHRQEFDNNNGQSNSNTVLHGEYQVQQKVDLLGETVITGGVVWRQVRSEAELYRGNADNSSQNTATNTAGYLQIDKKLFKRLTISGGVRYEQFKVDDMEAGQPVYRAGATMKIHKATYLRASYGQGFRFPTIGERFIFTSVGNLRVYSNPELKAENSYNLEGGVKQGFKIGKFTGYVDAVVFQQDYKNYVEFTFGQWAAPAGLSNYFGLGFKSVNTGGARVTGYEFELAGKGNFGPVEISTLLGYTHTTPVSTTPDQVYAVSPIAGSLSPPSTYESTSHDPSNNILKFRIQNLFRGDLQAQYKRFLLGGSVRYNSHVRNIDKAFITLDAPGLLPTGITEWMDTHKTGDVIVDARVGIELMEQLRVSFIVNNLTNKTYSMRPLSVEAPRSMQVQMALSL